MIYIIYNWNNFYSFLFFCIENCLSKQRFYEVMLFLLSSSYFHEKLFQAFASLFQVTCANIPLTNKFGLQPQDTGSFTLLLKWEFSILQLRDDGGQWVFFTMHLFSFCFKKFCRILVLCNCVIFEEKIELLLRYTGSKKGIKSSVSSPKWNYIGFTFRVTYEKRWKNTFSHDRYRHPYLLGEVIIFVSLSP